jgi:hypothetical protein
LCRRRYYKTIAIEHTQGRHLAAMDDVYYKSGADGGELLWGPGLTGCQKFAKVYPHLSATNGLRPLDELAGLLAKRLTDDDAKSIFGGLMSRTVKLPTFQLRSDFRGRVVPFGNPVAFAFVSRVPLETAYWDGTSAPSNAAPYMRYATTGAAQLLKPPIIHRVEPLSAVEIPARIADASGFSIDRRAAGARNTLQPWKLFFLTWGSPYCPTPRTSLLQLVIILPGNVGSTIYARCSLPVCT